MHKRCIFSWAENEEKVKDPWHRWYRGMTTIKWDLKSLPLNSGQESGMPWTVVQVVPCTRVPSSSKHEWKQLLSASQVMAWAGLYQLLKGYHFLTHVPKVGSFFFFLISSSPCRCIFFLVNTKDTSYKWRDYIKSHSIGCEQEQNRKLRGNLGPHTTPTVLDLPSYRPHSTQSLCSHNRGKEQRCCAYLWTPAQFRGER